MNALLKKKYAGLPGWAWLLIGVAGIGAGLLLLRWQQSKSANSAATALTASTQPDLTTGNQAGEESNPAQGTVGNNGVIDNPFPETTVNGQQVPIVPPGYQAVYDENGNLIGFEPISQPSPPATPAPTPPFHPGPVPPEHRHIKAVASGALADRPAGTWVGGKNIGTVPEGANLELLQGPTSVTVKGIVNHYYQVIYDGMTGWVNAKTIGLGGGGQLSVERRRGLY